MTALRSIDELDDPDALVWSEQIHPCIAQGTNTLLPITDEYGRAQLAKLQMTTWSMPGAMTRHCGGILADHGWIKLLGGGTTDLPSLRDYLNVDADAKGFAICAVDVLGGAFAINWGSFDGPHHGLWYWAPDTLAWEACGEWKHWDLVYLALTGGLDGFYADLRWPGWENACAGLAPDEGISLMPEPFTTQGQDKTEVSVRALPMAEICRVHQTHTHPDGLFHDQATSNRYPIYWTAGRHHRPDIDRFPTVRTLTEVPNPFWPQLEPLLAAGPHQVLPPDPDVADRRLVHLEHGVDTGIGAMVHNCEIMLADHGWLRLLGCGTNDPDSVDLVSGLSRRALWMVAYDVLGGIFTINLGHFRDVHGHGHMWHWSTNTGRWHPMGFTYEHFLSWSLSGGLAAYYHGMRWPGWESVASGLTAQDGLIDRQPTSMSAVVAHLAARDTGDPYPIVWSQQRE